MAKGNTSCIFTYTQWLHSIIRGLILNTTPEEGRMDITTFGLQVRKQRLWVMKGFVGIHWLRFWTLALYPQWPCRKPKAKQPRKKPWTPVCPWQGQRESVLGWPAPFYSSTSCWDPNGFHSPCRLCPMVYKALLWGMESAWFPVPSKVSWGVHGFAICLIFLFFFSFWWFWGLNSGLCTCKAGALLLVLHFRSILCWLFCQWGSFSLFAWAGLETWSSWPQPSK
jgi:hypothetical protein